LACLALWAVAGLCAEDGPPAPAGTAQPAVQPGAEFSLRWDPIGGDVPVYVPTDYDAGRRWPVVLFYHGMGGEPTTALFRGLTNGKGAIVVGMGYAKHAGELRTAEEKNAHQLKELAQLERMLEELPRRLRVDRSRVFLAGVSKGGWQVSAFAQAARPPVAGYAILLAGRLPRGHMDRPELQDKAVYVGTGETDANNPYARMAAQFFGRCGAQVTWEEYPDRGHEVDPAAPRLLAWVDMMLGATGDTRRERAKDWVAGRLARANDTADAGKCYAILSGVSDDPRYRFCGEALRAQVEAILEQVSLKSEVQPEVQAQRVYERGLWEEQTAAGLSDLESALALYKQGAKRYPKTDHGRLAEREAARVERLVDDGHAQARARAPKLPRPKVTITK